MLQIKCSCHDVYNYALEFRNGLFSSAAAPRPFEKISVDGNALPCEYSSMGGIELPGFHGRAAMNSTPQLDNYSIQLQLPAGMYYLLSVNGLNQSSAKSTKSARMLAQKLANKTGSTVWVKFGLDEASAKQVATAFPATEFN